MPFLKYVNEEEEWVDLSPVAQRIQKNNSSNAQSSWVEVDIRRQVLEVSIQNCVIIIINARCTASRQIMSHVMHTVIIEYTRLYLCMYTVPQSRRTKPIYDLQYGVPEIYISKGATVGRGIIRLFNANADVDEESVCCLISKHNGTNQCLGYINGICRHSGARLKMSFWN